MADVKILTQSGYDALVAELEDLKVNRRKENAQKLKEAREQGDLSENAEYDAAKDEQTEIAKRIEEIDNILKDAQVVADDEIDTKKINIGSKVKVHDEDYNEDIEYTIVGSSEADSLAGKISNESPVGAALIGHKKNDVVKVEFGSNTVTLKVLKISKA